MTYIPNDDGEPYYKPFDYINKDLDLLFVLIFIEAYKAGRDLLNFGEFFKGNYWDMGDVKDGIIDTNDFQSVPDMVLEQTTFLFEDLKLGKVIEVGIDDTSEALRDLLIEVAKIGPERASEEALYFTEAVEHICFLEHQEKELRKARAYKDPKNFREILRFGDNSVFFPNNEERGYFKAMQPVVIHVPDHILIRISYSKEGIERIEAEIADFLRKFEQDELVSEPAPYQQKRNYFSKQIESFYRYISKQNLIGDTINIPFSILAEKDFEAVKILKYLQLHDVIQMRWSDEGSWKVRFKRLPITPNGLIGSVENTEISTGFKANLDFDATKSILLVGEKIVKIRKGSDQYHLLRIMFEGTEPVGQEWFYSNIAEKYDYAARFDDKKFYNAAYQVRQKIARDTGLPDVLLTTAQSVRINPKYVR